MFRHPKFTLIAGAIWVFTVRVSAQSPIPLLQDFSIANSASFIMGTVAPGSLASAFARTGVTQNFFPTSSSLPNALGGVSLRIGGSLTFDSQGRQWVYSSSGSIQTPLLFVGSDQINFQVPPGISLHDSVPAQLTRPDGSGLITTIRITGTVPGIFTLLMNGGRGQAAVLNQDKSPNFGTNPARRVSEIQIFATGGGDTDPALAPGQPAFEIPLARTRVLPRVTIGGIAAQVFFSGMAPGYVGLWQINAEVPAGVTPGPAVPLVITAGGVTSNTVTIAVE